ncbi:MAG: hypothetical protein JSV05_03980 [Candidatus Bathyarchaeota archaeon]|nr:MAG: hypothetical protein JSV05_03980 [Candidatus Bathyarchaeota archaeon]
MGGTYDTMAHVTSSYDASAQVPYADDSINCAIVDNQEYTYYLHGVLRTGDAWHGLGSVFINYTTTETLP